MKQHLLSIFLIAFSLPSHACYKHALSPETTGKATIAAAVAGLLAGTAGGLLYWNYSDKKYKNKHPWRWRIELACAIALPALVTGSFAWMGVENNSPERLFLDKIALIDGLIFKELLIRH